MPSDSLGRELDEALGREGEMELLQSGQGQAGQSGQGWDFVSIACSELPSSSALLASCLTSS